MSIPKYENLLKISESRVSRKVCFHALILKKRNHKIGTHAYKIQISNRYLKIISISCIFFVKLIIQVLYFNDIGSTFSCLRYYL